MKLKVRNFTVAVILAWIVNVFFILGFALFQEKPKEFILKVKQKILIFAAHQDDCVIEAGGLAAQNIKLGGEVEIVYLTQPADKETARIRKKEASRAWAFLGSSQIRLSFLGYYSGKTWTEEKKTSARQAVASVVQRIKPDLLVIPLAEGGNPEHDLLNTLVRHAMAQFPDISVMQAAEYNPYYVIKNTPVKTLWFLARLAPFIPYKEPNYGLVPKNQLRLQMTPDELSMKMKMLAAFESQSGVINEGQFGYADLFENTVSLPDGCLPVKGKFFSPWTFLTILLTFLTIWCWGLAAGLEYETSGVYLIVAVTLSVLLALIVKGPLFIIEELLFPIDFLFGMIIAKFPTITHSLRKKRLRPLIN